MRYQNINYDQKKELFKIKLIEVEILGNILIKINIFIHNVFCRNDSSVETLCKQSELLRKLLSILNYLNNSDRSHVPM